MTTVAEFIEQLRLERLRRRVKQGNIAAKLGVAQSALCNWEHGRGIPTDEHIVEWAALLELDVPDGVSGRVDVVAACGTNSGYQRHLKHGEKPCAPCRRAHADKLTAWRHGKKAA